MKKTITLLFSAVTISSYAQTIQVSNLSQSIDSGSVLCTDRNKKAFWLRPSTNGKVLTMQNNKPQWVNPTTLTPNAMWSPAGNWGTSQANDYVGNRDNVGLSFRTNNTIRATITNTGKYGIGTTTPSHLLTVSGTDPLRLIGLTSGSSSDSVLVTSSGVVKKLPMAVVGNSWHLNGNTATDTSFIGTNNNKPFRVKVNGVQVGLLDTAGAINGWSNVAFGQGALNSLSTGEGNVSIGENTMSANVLGEANVAIGLNALSSNINGGGNTAIGAASLASSTGNNNVGIGQQADVLAGYGNGIAIGLGATISRSNLAQIGNDSVTVQVHAIASPIYVFGNTNYVIGNMTGSGYNVYDTYVAGTAFSATRTVTLPPPASCVDGVEVTVKDIKGIGTGKNLNIAVNNAGTEDIDGNGAANITLTTQGAFARLKLCKNCGGSGIDTWLVISYKN